MTIPRRWLSVSEVAEYLSMHHSTVRRKINKGEIPSARIGKTLRIDLLKLEEQMEQVEK